jgi:hypothetical protein
MARFRPAGLTGKEQDALREARFTAEAESTSKRAAFARDDYDSKFDRLRKRAASLGIVRADELPQLAPLLQIQRSLMGGLARVEAELDLISLERYLLKGGVSPSNRENLKAKRDMRRAQLKIEPPAAPPAGDLPFAVTRALEVLAKNAAIKALPSREGRMAELQGMQVDYENGLREIYPLIEAAKSDAAYDKAIKLQARHQKLHLELFRLEQAYSEKAAEERALREALVHAGYTARSDLLPAPSTLNVTLMLGQESDWNSAISAHRRALENRGILK